VTHRNLLKAVIVGIWNGERGIDRISIVANLATVLLYPLGQLARWFGHPLPYLMTVPYRFRTPYGTLLAPGGLFYLQGCREYEPDVAASVDSLESGTFIDVGAGIGNFTLQAGRKLGQLGHVIAIEPVPNRFACLRANVEASGLKNIRCVQVAAGSGYRATLTLADLTLGRNQLDISEYGVGSRFSVTCESLDNLVEPEERVRLVKIDVEGGELAVLRGMARILSYDKPIVVFECLDRVQEISCREFLSSHGYKVEGLVPGNLVAQPATKSSWSGTTGELPPGSS
jgi:FkbM family methyltransferase